MNLLFYSKVKTGAGEGLERVIEALLPVKNIKVCRTIDNFSRRLRQPGKSLKIAVILAASREDLLEILSMGDLFEGFRIILVLPDREEDTISKGHKLRPRFLTYADSDLGQVGAVLEKMLGDSAVIEKKGGAESRRPSSRQTM